MGLPFRNGKKTALGFTPAVEVPSLLLPTRELDLRGTGYRAVQQTRLILAIPDEHPPRAIAFGAL
jgi:hypothetical protein